MDAACVKVLLGRSRELHSDSPRLDVELLLAHVLQKERVFLRAWPEHCLDPVQLARFEQLLARRRRGEPIAHLTGRREFWSLELTIDASTLIPRPETETLVAEALARCPGSGLRVLDLGTGSGAIALALASERPRWQIDAVDLEPACLDTARYNAERHGLRHVRFLHSDWFEALSGRYGLIVSNPPYIDVDDPHLNQDDVRFEPRRALVAEDKGLAAIRHIVARAPDWLESDAWLIIEHGWQQGAACGELFAAAGFDAIDCIRDLAGRDRVTLGRRA